MGSAEVKEVEPQALRRWLEEDSVVLVDVREPHECEQERIVGGVLLPTSTLDMEQVPVVEGKPVVFY